VRVSRVAEGPDYWNTYRTGEWMAKKQRLADMRTKTVADFLALWDKQK
jgi:hypothetical protein